MGLICKLSGHKWNGCKCERCGMSRDEQHDWDLCKGLCRRCGAMQAEQHDWDNGVCSVCGYIDQSVLVNTAKNEKENDKVRLQATKMKKRNIRAVVDWRVANRKKF